ncbi:MAG: hypothetical protein JXA99_03150 [Candidatus Lokiarchaeota archaeon]|nr:hypothetical protein [Candidatus Lokiarchaeota archaeon]
MNRLLTLFFILCLSCNKLISSDIFHYKNVEFGRDIEFIIKNKKVSVSEYKMKYAKYDSHKYYYLINYEDSIDVIDSIFVRFEGVALNIPKKFYFDIIQPDIGHIKYIGIGDDNKSIIIVIPCWEGGASYFAWLEISVDNGFRRYFYYYDDQIGANLLFNK